jgi:MFS transporter, DHA1 family, inner membrane transport protein
MPQSRLLALIAGNFFVATSFMSVSGLLTQIAQSFNISISTAGGLFVAFGVSAGICAPTLATMGSKIDRRRLLTGAMAICSLANALAAFSDTFDHLMAARILAAVTSAVYTPQVAATVSMLVPESERPPTLAKLMVGWSVGSVLGSPLSVVVGTSYGWRISFAAIAILSAITTAFIWRSLPDGVHVPPLNIQRWLQILRSPALRWLTGATFFTNVGSTIMLSYIAPIVKVVQNVEGKMLAALIFCTGIGGLIGNILSVRLVRKYGPTNVAYKCNGSAAIVLTLWPALAWSVTTIFLVQFAWSLGNAGFPAVQQARLVAVAPNLAGATIALNSSVTYLGGAVGGKIGSLVWGVVPARFMSWVGVGFVLAALTCSMMGERAARRQPVEWD